MNILNANEWAAISGLLPIHLTAEGNMDRFIMLDGGFYDFCLDLTKEERDLSNYSSDAWSSNAKNYVYIDDNKVKVYNWLKDEPESIPLKIVKEKFVQFVNILNKNSYRTSDDVMPFVLSLFRQMRNQTHEKKEPLEALNLLYKLLISLQEDNINSTVCEKWGILDIDEPQGFDTLIEYIRKGCRNIQPNLDLILRHSSGVLFQEAHREALSFDTQYNLFGEMSSSIELKSPTLYSSIHYTPQYLARSIVEKSINKLNLNKPVLRILDPACGSGSFIIEILKQLKERGFSGSIEVDALDCSSCAVSTTRFLIAYEKRTQWKDKLSFKVYQVSDSLQEEWLPKYDIILMNPPFLSMEQIKNKEEKETVNQILSPLNMRKRPNQAAAFLYKAVCALNDDGILGVVLPSSILLLEQYVPLRNAIREMSELHIVARLGNYVFEDALTDVSFVIIKKKESSSFIPQTIWCRNKAAVAYEALKELRKMEYLNIVNSIKKDYNIYTPSKFPIVHETWKTVPLSDDLFVQKVHEWKSIKKLCPLQNVFDIKQGILKGCKNAFEISRQQFENLNDDEKKLYRPLASSDTIMPGHIMEKVFIWYPYDNDGLMINSEDDLSKYPISLRYLLPFKEKLLTRKEDKNWWELTRSRTWQYIPQKYLISKRFGNASSFAINETNYVVEEGNAFIFNKSKYIEEDYYFYLSVLSSSTFERLLSIYAKPLLSGYDLGKINIKDIPVPDITDEFRITHEYKELVKYGHMYASGITYVKQNIDSIVSWLYPYEEERTIVI